MAIAAKDVHRTITDVSEELADVILAAGVPLVDLVGGPIGVAQYLARRLGVVSTRDVAGVPTSTKWLVRVVHAPHVLLCRDDGQVLMLRRRNTRYRDGWLAPPAG